MAERPDPAAAALLPRCTFPPAGTAVTCAVSGGPDSMALLALAAAAGLAVTAVHVDHQLRPGSAEEAAVVRAACADLDARFRAVTVGPFAGGNVEARARAARYAALPPDVLTGHTLDDQAETVLLNLSRGAAIGLSAMQPGWRRPLLALRRTETAGLCAALGLAVVDDPSNRDRRFTRNRIRQELMPLLADIGRRDPAPILARQADLLRDDHALLDELAAALDPTDALALRGAPLALARRAVRRWLTGEHPPDAATIERVLAVAAGAAPGCDVGGGRQVRRSHHRLRLVPPPPRGDH